MKWGSNLRDLPELRLLAEEGDLKFFEKVNELTRIGDADVDKIIYGFYKDRFYNVMIYFSSLVILPVAGGVCQGAWSTLSTC